MRIPEGQLSPADALKLCLGSATLIVLPVAGVYGGMVAILMLLAAALAWHTYGTPKDALVAGPLFLMAGNVLLPSSARFDFTIEPWEQYYWAVGICLITTAAFAKTGLRPLLRMPRSLQVFVSVAVLASAYGLVRGNEPSYVVRQLFGSLLLAAYFALALEGAEEKTFLQSLRRYGVPCALGFVGYYAWVFSQYGIHKEITSIGTQAAILGVMFIAVPGWKWKVASSLMLAVPLLLVVRRDLAAFALALVVIWAFSAKSVLLRVSYFLLAAFLVLISLAPPYVGMVLDAALGTTSIERFLPAGARDATSIEDRGLQLAEAGMILQQSPVFGYGMGASLGWQSVARGDMEQAYVDNGWAYVAVKMGIAGILAFGWFLVDLIRRMPGASVPLSTCLLSLVLLVMFAEPVFFQFTTSPFVGAMAGLLYAKSRVAVPDRVIAAEATA